MNLLRITISAFFILMMSYGVSNAQDPDNRLFGLTSSEPAKIFSINPTTGAALEVLTLNGNSSIVGLSFITGTPFGSDLEDFPGSGPNFNVGLISPAGVITFLSDQNGSSNWQGLASDDCDGRVLYAIDQNTSPDFFLRELSLNGTISTIGPTGVNGAGLAFDDENRILYALEDGVNLYTISVNDGTSELIGSTGLEDFGNDIGLAYDEINRVLYAIAGEGNGSLFSLNVETGQATLIGQTGVDFEIDGLGWREDCDLVRPIPTLSEWGLIAMAGVLGIVGLFAIRRRKITA